MTEPDLTQASAPDAFADLPRTAAAHFQLCSYAAISHVLLSLAGAMGSLAAAVREFPFLAGYHAELLSRGLEWSSAPEAAAWWKVALGAWEAGVEEHLPRRALQRATALSDAALTILTALGLVEEDPRFGALLDVLQAPGDVPGPTVGVLAAWWPEGYRDALRQLRRFGLVRATRPADPSSQQRLHVPEPIWEALRGEVYAQFTPWARYDPPERLLCLEDLILPPSCLGQAQALPGLLASGLVEAVVMRGPGHAGRHTLLGAIARAMGRGALTLEAAPTLEADNWRMLGALAKLLHALPILSYDLSPGEAATVPELAGCDAPAGVVLGASGSLSGPALERSVTITLGLPDPAARRQHWQWALGTAPAPALDEIAERHRITSGNIHRAAPLARAHAALNGRAIVEAIDVQMACRTLHRRALETMASRLDVLGDWSLLAVDDDTRRDLLDLATRCRQRERLPSAGGEALNATVNPGTRALFTGPSGTGKTLAARILAAELGLEVYRLDLAAVVNKYIGETEKNLNQLFSRAEELDVILLIDEGDALLTQRTQVSGANDRYANLETNFLLQRLETYHGIVIITTNSSERIDRAFQRRMDVVVEFRTPEAAERWQLWHMHLPHPHSVDTRLLTDVATRCALTGGQIRNAALHAALLALDNGGVVTSGYLEEAVRRAYRQTGTVCPLGTRYAY